MRNFLASTNWCLPSSDINATFFPPSMGSGVQEGFPTGQTMDGKLPGRSFFESQMNPAADESTRAPDLAADGNETYDQCLPYQRSSLGPSTAPATVHKTIVPPYQSAMKGS